LVRRGHAERADRGGAMTAHPPDLPGHLDGRGLAVGAGDRDHGGRNRTEELRREAREGPAWLRVDEVSRALDPGLGPGDDGNRSGSDGCIDEVFAIGDGALERTEDRAWRHLAVVDGEPGHLRVAEVPCIHTG